MFCTKSSNSREDTNQITGLPPRLIRKVDLVATLCLTQNLPLSSLTVLMFARYKEKQSGQSIPGRQAFESLVIR